MLASANNIAVGKVRHDGAVRREERHKGSKI